MTSSTTMPNDRPGHAPRPLTKPLVWLAALLVCAPVAALAERADRDKPISVEADSMRYDDLRQVNVFTGNVTLTKGTILIRGDRLTLRQDPEGYQYGTAEGAPASFRQKRDGVDQFIVGVGQKISYDGKTETVRLQERASLKRLERERVIDEVYGKLITYDSRTEVFNVDGGGGAAAASPENPGGRVRVVIQPRNTPAPSSAPATLTPSRSLEPAAK